MKKLKITKGKIVEIDLSENEVLLKNAEEQKYNVEKVEKDIIQKRLDEYGSPQEQIEFITENGLAAWAEKVNKIKLKYPKLGK